MDAPKSKQRTERLRGDFVEPKANLARHRITARLRICISRRDTVGRLAVHCGVRLHPRPRGLKADGL
jgi:hypothetical protein